LSSEPTCLASGVLKYKQLLSTSDGLWTWVQFPLKDLTYVFAPTGASNYNHQCLIRLKVLS
jgi:hypothetical protein